MADLFEVAKARNKDEFVRICTENVAYAAKHRLDENGNPFHIAASQEILLPALKEIMRNLEEGTKSKVKKAEEAKQIAGIKGGFICNSKFHLCLYIIGAIACIAALCLSLYFLFLVSQSLALASVATIASGGSTCLLFKACNGIYGLYDESTIVTDPDVMQLLNSDLAVA
ncbi:ankyrin repeat domain-containing protein [Wolbachia endosymbiont of Delia radicum]|uniref:ankyrin repeat domain-containing protein n=1 Tax=Wolbachia endosymbiont of Delia radicum TaxID=502352 RepID=UPI001F478943|nr:ankyrin repeat domain-containing protein [Wolbachia endosymbiont of Delia radicum]UJQ21182.1 ankyrin repeat domain-containing protein [Wolbachia endosymbiont of Delia radicum]